MIYEVAGWVLAKWKTRKYKNALGRYNRRLILYGHNITFVCKILPRSRHLSKLRFLYTNVNVK